MPKINFINIIFYFLFIILIIVAVITPHVFHGYGMMSENYVQSIIIIFNIASGSVLYLYYQRKLENKVKENQRYEQRLIESYRYIGKVHGEMELLHDFMDNIKKYQSKDISGKREIFNTFLSFMLVSAAKVNHGLLRFIDIKKGRTIKDFIYGQSEKPQTIKLSNSEIIKGELQKAPDKNYLAIKSDYEIGDLKCVLTFPKTCSKPDFKLLKTLLNQTHLIFITFNRKMLKV